MKNHAKLDGMFKKIIFCDFVKSFCKTTFGCLFFNIVLLEVVGNHVIVINAPGSEELKNIFRIFRIFVYSSYKTKPYRRCSLLKTVGPNH